MRIGPTVAPIEAHAATLFSLHKVASHNMGRKGDLLSTHTNRKVLRWRLAMPKTSEGCDRRRSVMRLDPFPTKGHIDRSKL